LCRTLTDELFNEKAGEKNAAVTHSAAPIAVAYLARGADMDSHASIRRFISSYKRYKPGIPHALYVIFKGYATGETLASARQLFEDVRHIPVFLEDNSFDIGAYIEWSHTIAEEVMCPLNTASEVVCDGWLIKLYKDLQLPDVAVVGASASFESLHMVSSEFYGFPNIHIRSTGFMVHTDFFRDITRDIEIRDKIDAFRFESGPRSMTRQALRLGKKVLLVGRNGRGYAPEWWPISGTFRQGEQDNLLIADNQTRAFASFIWPIKRATILRTWGIYIDGQHRLPDKKILGT
jgi:hypothetical protein